MKPLEYRSLIEALQNHDPRFGVDEKTGRRKSRKMPCWTGVEDVDRISLRLNSSNHFAYLSRFSPGSPRVRDLNRAQCCRKPVVGGDVIRVAAPQESIAITPSPAAWHHDGWQNANSVGHDPSKFRLRRMPLRKDERVSKREIARSPSLVMQTAEWH